MSIFKKLVEFSTIRTGITQRPGSNKDNTKPYILIQPKDIKDNDLILPLGSIEFETNLASNHILKKDDLLIVNKGMNFATFLYNDDSTDSLASNSFFIIKTDTKQCLPQYLQWFFQQTETKKYLSQNVTGATVPSLNKSVLEQVSVPLPTLGDQQKIIAFLQLSHRQNNILQTIIKTNEEFRDSYVWSLIHDR